MNLFSDPDWFFEYLRGDRKIDFNVLCDDDGIKSWVAAGLPDPARKLDPGKVTPIRKMDDAVAHRPSGFLAAGKKRLRTEIYRHRTAVLGSQAENIFALTCVLANEVDLTRKSAGEEERVACLVRRADHALEGIAGEFVNCPVCVQHPSLLAV